PEVGDRYATASALLHDLEAFLATRASPSLAQLGARISEAFERERGDLQHIISQHLGSSSGHSDSDRVTTPTRAAPRSSLSFGDVTSTSGVAATTNGASSLGQGQLSSTSAQLFAETMREQKPRNLQRMFMAAAALAVVVGAAYVLLPRPFGAPGGDALVATAAAVAPAADRCTAADKPLVELSGDIEEDARLECDKDYLIKFQLFVKSGVSLTIEQGTRLLGDTATKGTLVV